MRKKDRLYTVNPWNKNLFTGGGDIVNWNSGAINTSALSNAISNYSNQASGNSGISTNTLGWYSGKDGMGIDWSSGADMAAARGSAAAALDSLRDSNQNMIIGFGKQGIQGTNINSTSDTNHQLNPNGGKSNINYGQMAASIGKGIAQAAPTDPFTINGKKFDRGAWDLLDPTYYMANGRNSKVGDMLSDTGVQLTKSGNPWMMLAGAALKIGGSFANAGWGVKANKENIALLNQNSDRARGMAGYLNNATTNEDILNMSGYLANNTGMNWHDLYSKDGWFVKGKAQKEGTKLLNQHNTSLAMQNASLINSIENLEQETRDRMARYNISAFGGPLGGYPMDSGMPAIDYGNTQDYLTIKAKQADSKNKMGNMFAGVPNSMFALGGDLQSHGRNYAVGKVYEVDEKEANRLKAMGYGFTVVS